MGSPATAVARATSFRELLASLCFFGACLFVYHSNTTTSVALQEGLHSFADPRGKDGVQDRQPIGVPPHASGSSEGEGRQGSHSGTPTLGGVLDSATASKTRAGGDEPRLATAPARRNVAPASDATVRPRPPGAKARGGNTHKGINSVFGLETNNDLFSRPEWTRVQEQCPVDFSAAVQQQLVPWPDKGSITQARLDRLFCVRKQVAKISYVGGELRHASFQLNMDLNRLQATMWLVHLAAARARAAGRLLPDFEIVLNPTDKTSAFAKGRSTAWEDPLPLFCNAKCAGDTSISFPIMFNGQFGGAGGEMSVPLYESKYRELQAMGAPARWRDKKPFLFFSSTNVRGNRAAIFRSRSPSVTALPEVVPVEKYGEYKYLIYAYGHSGWSQRLRELAFMDAVVLMENSSCHEYYHYAFDQGRHYIAAREDLSDLEARLAEATADDARAEAMASGWVRRGREVLRLPCVLQYVEDVLREYAARQAFDPVPRPSWPLHRLNVTQRHFVATQPPPLEECRPYM